MTKCPMFFLTLHDLVWYSTPIDIAKLECFLNRPSQKESGVVVDESLRRQASQRGLGIDSSAATAATSPQLEQEQQQQQSQVRKDLLWGP